MLKSYFLIPLAGILSAFLALAACVVGEPTPTATPWPTTPPPTATPAPELPGTNAGSMMSYLEQVDYQSWWELWPGFGEKYLTGGTHSIRLTTYVNPPAHAAIIGKEGALPADSIIVKENYTDDGEFTATTVMYKVEGYNPEHNDWFWLKVLADGTVDQEGRPDGCQVCHSELKANDYIWTGGPTSLSK